MTQPYSVIPIPPPVPDGVAANVVRWWHRLFSPINAVLDFYLADDTGWIDFAVFANSWTNYGGGWGQAQFRRKRGIVYLRGLVKSGAALTVMLDMPVGFRPGYTQTYICWAGAGYARIDVGGNGSITLVNWIGGGDNTYVTLSDISYMAEQ